MEGVIDVESSLVDSLFIVQLKDDTILTKEQVREAITNSGFTLRSFQKIGL